MTRRFRVLVATCLLCIGTTAIADSDGAASELPMNEPVDLLPLITLPDHALRGTWRRDEDALICEPSVDALLMAPVALHGSFEIEFEFTRRTGEGSVSLICPIGAPSGFIAVHGWEGNASGLGRVNGVLAPNLELSTGAVVRPGRIENGQRYQLHVNVTQARNQVTIRATLNQQRFINWRGPREALTNIYQTALPCAESLGILVSKSSVVDIHQWHVTVRRGGEAYQLADDFANPLSEVRDAPPPQIARRCLTIDRRSYYISDEPLDLDAAQRLAAQLEGRLLTISSADEEELIIEQARGVSLWMSGWRKPGSDVWRDERNRPLRYIGRWRPGQPQLRGHWDLQLAIHTASNDAQGWHDYLISSKHHVCVEWGEEYADEE